MKMNGWGSETFGFTKHNIPMYLHLDSKNDKVFGDLFMKIRVGNPRNFPKNLDNSEMDYLNRKIRQVGAMPWHPGEECLKREFKPYWDVKNDRGETVPKFGTPTMGCKPCRDREAAKSGLTAGTTEAISPALGIDKEPPEAGADVVQPETIKCDLCDEYTAKLVRRNGSLSTIKQQRFGLKVHKRKKHKKPRTAKAVPA